MTCPTCAALQAEVERMRAVVEAARGVINCVDPERDPPAPGDDVAVDHAGGCLWVLVNALEALDATPPLPVAESGPISLSRTDSTTVHLTPKGPAASRGAG